MSYASAVTRGVVCLMLVACATPAAPVSPKPMTADDILRATADTYAHARSYTDHGQQTTTFHGKPSFVATKTFQTAFERDGRFRFEYREEGDPARAFVVWSDGSHAQISWYVKPGILDAKNLSFALAAATGVSGGTAHNIPALLMPAVGGRLVTSIDHPVREADETIDGQPCFRISGSAHQASFTLWIDVRSHMVRQIRERSQIPGKQGPIDVDAITTYKPSPDTAVDPLQVQPPSPAAATEQPAWLGVMFDGHGGTTRVQSVVAGGPASHAGLQAGDVITKIDAQPVAKAEDVILRVRDEKPGATLHLTLSRGGKEMPLDVTLEKRPDLDELQGRFVGQPAPDFALAAMSGPTSAKLADLKGHVVIVDFWATWCGPCAMAMPHLVDLAHRYKDLRVVGISDEDEGDIRAYVAAHKIDYTIARDADDVVTGHYLVTGLPTLVIIDKAGVVRALHVGAGDFDTIEAEVQQYLK